MPSRVEILGIYMGENPLARLNKPAWPLELPEDANRNLLRSIRTDLLANPTGFCRTIRLADLGPIELEWVVAGQTGGMAVWSHKGEEQDRRLAGAVSLVLSGLDEGSERLEILAAMATRRLPVPADLNARLDKDLRRPLVVNLFYHTNYFLDPLLATVVPALANTFFALLGTNIQL